MGITKYVFLAVVAQFLLRGISAQDSASSARWKFHSLNQIGLLQGEASSSFHVQSVNGLQRRNLFVGLGAGVDYYRYKSVPVFASVRQYFGKKNNQFFIYTDAGIQFVWEKTTAAFFSADKYYPGFYSNAGVGYKAGLKNGMGFLLSVGYSYKRVKYRQHETGCPFLGPCYSQTDFYTYDLNRFIMQIGWLF